MSQQDARNYDDELASIMNALAESAIGMTDEEIFEEVRADGLSPDVEAAAIKQLFKNTAKSFRQRRLLEAQRQYEENVRAEFEQVALFPTTTEERRALLASVFSHRPEIGAALLTAQHRDFKELSDEDVESYLRQLHQLGALNLTAEAGSGEEEN